jgi:hypothetical protein
MSEKQHLVYFIKAKSHHFVKIGKSKNIETLIRRVDSIIGREPFESELIGISDIFPENEIHFRLQQFRIRAEWFYWNKQVKQFVRDYCNLFLKEREGEYGYWYLIEELESKKQKLNCDSAQKIINLAYQNALTNEMK